MKPHLPLFCLLTLTLLSSCAPFKPNNEHAGYCNQLNSEMIFSGNTSDTRKANIENAQAPLVQYTYDKACR